MTSLLDSIPKETKRSRLPLLNEKRLGDRDYCTLLLGEANPYGGDPRYALYPEPEGSSGWRLCHMVMGLRSQTYLDWFVRDNVFATPPAKWSIPAARRAAREVLARTFGNYGNDRVVVVLGRKVAAACGVDVGTRDVQEGDGYRFLFLPHPSALNREWRDPNEARRCREFLADHLHGIPFGEAL
jgi:hypothetical protein